ncbi:MAG: glycosyltransferase [Desulfurivibrionaceae bacterium]
MPPKLSICIPTYNRAGLLKRQLRTLELALSRIPICSYEIVFRDNASIDETPQVIQTFAQRLPVKYVRNSENIGAISNVLSVPREATGEFVWLLGDDDLVLPYAFEKIFKSFENFPEVEGHVVSHAIEREDRREILESSILTDEAISCHMCLIRNGTKEKYLPRFEEVFKLTDIGAALNFLSNVIFLRKDWIEKVGPYLAHCESHDALSDVITVGGHTCIWAEILVGKPIAVINTPLVIGFVGQQKFLAQWDVICWVFFLDLSKRFLEFGADPDCIRIYQRNIYRSSTVLGRLVVSNDEYTKKYFSLKALISNFGDDEVLWQSLMQALHSVHGGYSKLKFVTKLGFAIIKSNRRWFYVVRMLLRKLKKMIRSAFRKETVSRKTDYSARFESLNCEATDFFKMTVAGASDANIKHPLYLKNQKYLSVGQGFYSGPGLRIEAWDQYRGQTFSPKIKIGERVIFNSNCHIGAIDSIEIGNDVLVGSNILITDHQHGNPHDYFPSKTYADQPLYSKGPVIIGDNVLIGENVCIMPGVAIGTNCVIGANAVVTRDVPDNSISAGNPAKVIRNIWQKI